MLHLKVVTKAKNRIGASLSMAMLLFLVCAVIGAVVLTAGTAAAGRLSRMAEMDRRYYSVTSAAELLADKLTDTTVTIERTRAYTEETVKSYTVGIDSEGNESITENGTAVSRSATYSTAVNGSLLASDVQVDTVGDAVPVSNVGSSISLSGCSFLTTRALKLMFGGSPCNTDAAMGYSFSPGNSESAFSFTMEHSSAAVSVDSLGVKGTCTMKSDGTIVIRLMDDGTKDNYVLVITLIPHIDESTNTKSGGTDTPTVARSGSEMTQTVRNTLTVTKTSSVYWTLGSIAKEVSSPDENP